MSPIDVIYDVVVFGGVLSGFAAAHRAPRCLRLGEDVGLYPIALCLADNRVYVRRYAEKIQALLNRENR